MNLKIDSSISKRNIPDNTMKLMAAKIIVDNLKKKTRTDNNRALRQMHSAMFQLQMPLCNHDIIAYIEGTITNVNIPR